MTSRSHLDSGGTDIIATATLTCPMCGHQATETMPRGACQYFYDCKGCGAVLKPKAGDCCVFCSYGDVPARRSRPGPVVHDHARATLPPCDA